MADGGTGMIACSYIFIENCSIRAVEGVLHTMGMTQMVDLATSLRIGVKVFVVFSSAVKGSVRIMCYYFNWPNFFDRVGSFC